MAQIILTGNERVEIKEDLKQFLQLITDEYLFVIVDVKHIIDVSKSKYEYETRIEYIQTAINKAHIIKAF